MFKRSLKEFCC